MLIFLIHQNTPRPVIYAKAIPLLKIKEIYSLKSSSDKKSKISTYAQYFFKIPSVL